MKNIIKFVALVTCLVMMLSVVATAADTKVYLTYDFANNMADPTVETATDADVNAVGTTFGNPFNFAGNIYTKDIVARLAQNTDNKNYTAVHIYGSMTKVSSACSELYKNENGDWMFIPEHGRNTGNYSGMELIFAPNDVWVMNDTETYVISYDYLVRRNDETLSGYDSQWTYPNETSTQGNVVYWSNETATNEVGDAYLGYVAKTSPDQHELYYYAGYGNATAVNIDNNKTYRVATSYKKRVDNNGIEGAQRTFATRSFAIDGVNKVTYTNTGVNSKGGSGEVDNPTSGPSMESVDRIVATKFGGPRQMKMVTSGYGKIRMYTIKDGSFKLTSDVDATGVSVETKDMTIKFGNPVAEATFDSADVVLKANGVAVNAADYTVGDLTLVEGAVGGEIYSTVDITFNKNLDSGKTYTVEVDGSVANEIGETLGANNTVSFVTEAAPTYTVTLSACEGVKAGGTAISNLTSAAGKTVCLTANVVNNLYGKAVEDVITIGIYDSSDNLVKYAYASKALALNGSASFAAVFKIGANQTAKALIGDTVVVLGQN